MEKIELCIKGGIIRCYIETGISCGAGITFIPDGSDEEIDIAYVVPTDKNGTKNAKDAENLKLLVYGDAWTEDHTDEFVLNIPEMKRSVTEPFQPDSEKL